MSAISSTLAISIATAGGILLTALFIMWELGHYATPQVKVTRFDERREIFAYTVGLFVGILLAVPFDLYLFWIGAGNLISAFVFLAVVVALTEAAQWGVRRTQFWGAGPSFPFYAVGLRCGIAGLLVTILLTPPLAATTITWDGVATAVLGAGAVLMLMVTSALLSLPPDPKAGRPGGGPVSGGLILFVGLFLVGFSSFAGEVTGAIASLLALIGATYLYARLRTTLDRIRPGAAGPGRSALPSRFARQGPPGSGGER